MGNDTLSLKNKENKDNQSIGVDKTVHTGGATVTVASKLPMPLVLQLHSPVEQMQVHAGGVHKFIQFEVRRGAPTYTVVGNSIPHNSAPKQMIANGFGITPGIPKAFWEEWLEQHKDLQYVKEGMIFAHEELISVHSMAREREKIVTGLERIDRYNPQSRQEQSKFKIVEATPESA